MVARSRNANLDEFSPNDTALSTYKQFIAEAGSMVGELTPSPGESLNEIRLNLRRAARVLGVPIRTWIADNAVYFFLKGQVGEADLADGNPRKGNF